MHRFNDAFYVDALCGGFARTPDDAIARHQRTDSAADIATVNLAVSRLHIGMHTKTANDDTFCRLAKQVVIVVGFLRGRF